MDVGQALMPAECSSTTELRSLRARRRLERAVELAITQMRQDATVDDVQSSSGAQKRTTLLLPTRRKPSQRPVAIRTVRPTRASIAALANSPSKPPRSSMQREAAALVGQLHLLRPPETCAAIRPSSTFGSWGRRKRATDNVAPPTADPACASPILLLEDLTSIIVRRLNDRQQQQQQ